MEFSGEGFELRPWREGDEAPLTRHADDEEVARNLMDRFPHPYTLADARRWVAMNRGTEGPTSQFAIVISGAAAGGIGFERLEDVHAFTARIGYWLGRAFWGRGIATAALQLVTAHAFRAFDFERLEAEVFDWNPASRRVLEKAEYRLESRQSRRIVKRGVLMDGWLYARLRPAAAGESDGGRAEGRSG